LLQPANIGVAAQEPEQLQHDRLGEQLLGRHQREAVGEVVARLMAEHRKRAGAGAVALLHAALEHQFQEVVILPHGAAATPIPAAGRAGRSAAGRGPVPPGRAAPRPRTGAVSSSISAANPSAPAPIMPPAATRGVLVVMRADVWTRRGTVN